MKKENLTERRIHVAVVESDPLRVAGFRALLENYEDLQLRPLFLSEPDGAIDINVALVGRRHGQNLLHVMQQLKTVRPDLRVIVTALGRTDEAVLDALNHGARGYVDEAAPAGEFAKAIRTVDQGLLWASRRVLAMFVDRCIIANKRPLGKGEFTKREREVLEMLVAGRSNREIGVPLGIEERTVKAHVAKLMRKVGVQNRIALSVHALNHSIITAR